MLLHQGSALEGGGDQRDQEVTATGGGTGMPGVAGGIVHDVQMQRSKVRRQAVSQLAGCVRRIHGVPPRERGDSTRLTQTEQTRRLDPGRKRPLGCGDLTPRGLCSCFLAC